LENHKDIKFILDCH